MTWIQINPYSKACELCLQIHILMKEVYYSHQDQPYCWGKSQNFKMLRKISIIFLAKLTNLPVSPDPKGFTGLKCFKPSCSPLSRIWKSTKWRVKNILVVTTSKTIYINLKFSQIYGTDRTVNKWERLEIGKKQVLYDCKFSISCFHALSRSLDNIVYFEPFPHSN